MNSEFPMTFIEPEKKNNSRIGMNPRMKMDAGGSEHDALGQRVASMGRKKIIPISHKSLSRYSQVGGEDSGSGIQRPSLYPMSEFEVSGGAKNSQKYQRSPLRFLVRAALTLTLAALWIAIGTGELHSNSPSVTQTRTFLSEQVPALSSLIAANTVESSDILEQAERAPLSESATDVESASESFAIRETDTTSSQEDVGSSVDRAVQQADTSLEDRALSNAAESSSMTKLSSNVSQEKVELTQMLELFLEQGRQMQKMEEHLLEMVRKSASADRYSAFLSELRSRHASALEKMEAQK